MSPSTTFRRLMRAVAAGLMLLGAAVLVASALTIFRDGGLADWVPNLPSSPFTVVVGFGAIAIGALLRRRFQVTQPHEHMAPVRERR